MLVLCEDEADVRMRCIGWLPACSRHTGWIITCEKARIPFANLVAGLATPTQGAVTLVQILKRIATAKGGERAKELNLEGVSVLVAMTQSQ
jgi:hypothetical protein